MLEKNNILHLFELSKISCDEKELDSFSKDMEDIIELMDMVKTVDSSIKPLRNTPIMYEDLRDDMVYNDKDLEKITDNDLSIPKII